ncbi:ATP-dependent RNA helicase DDX19A-like isoform X4 [Montipora foliosa]
MGFKKPSKIQETAVPMLLADPPNNMIAQSQSGTGKTVAFVLSMLSRVDATKSFTQVICLSPTYELALQTGQVAEKMGKFCPEIKIGYAVRGERVSRGHKVTDHILFATPETLLDLLLRFKVMDPKKIKMFVLDDADFMFALQGHQDQVIRIHKQLPKDCQMLLFSATYNDEVMKFANIVVPDPIVIRLRREEESLDNIKQYYVVCCDQEDKHQALSNMYGVVSIGQCIVFCHTPKAASGLAQTMTDEGHSVALLSGEITVEQCHAVLNRFREGKEKLLITTNVCARGIDVEQVTVVVNYDMPIEPSGKPDFETYLHRIGRTGRFGKNGIAVNFIDGPRSMNIMKKIEEHFGKKISLLETNDVDELEKPENTAAVIAETSFLAKVLRNKPVRTKNEVEVQRNDPSSPLHSVKSFEELPLSEQLRRGVYDMGFNKPSKIQETALPMLLADPPNNMIAQSQSGTGKTAALVLSMLSRVDATKSFTQVIYLSPTYELALQTGQVAEKMGKFCPEIKIGYAVRGESVSRGQKVTDHILFAMPGTLLDWLFRFKVMDPKKIKMFVLDEADVIIALQGHQDQFIRIRKQLPKDCQILLFSATYDDEVMKFANTVVPDPIVIRLRRKEEILDNIKQYYVVCRDQEDKHQALSNMYGVVSIGQCIVFCNTRKAVSWLAQKMTAEGHSVALLSGEITVQQRLAVLNRFREGKEKLLITTNVCARAIDVEQVTVVVNYDMPIEPSGKPDFETYLHRIGRTGRFGKNGIAVNFIDGPRSMNIMKKIEEHFGKKISLLETNDVDELEKLS